MKKRTPKENTTKTKPITRREAVKKAGKYAAATALGTMIILSPKESQASSIEPTWPG